MNPNEVVAPHVLRGPDPRAWQYVAALDCHHAWSMEGHNGAYIGGSGPMMTGGRVYSGDLGPVQQFTRGLQASTTSIAGSLVEARLPATSTTAGINPNLAAILGNGGM